MIKGPPVASRTGNGGESASPDALIKAVQAAPLRVRDVNTGLQESQAGLYSR